MHHSKQMKCSRRLYGGTSTLGLQGGSFALDEVVSANRVAMLSVSTVVLFSIAGLAYIWNQTDEQIDRGNKIGFTVVFSSIIVATTLAIVFIAAPGLFALQRVNGYAYPSSIVYLLYAIAVALAVVCVFIQAGNLIADNTNRNIVLIILGTVSVLSAGLALYYQSTFLPVDWIKLRNIVLKQDVDKYIDPDILSSDVGRAQLAFAVDKSSMDPNLKSIIIQRLKDSTTGTTVLKEFKYVDSVETLEQIAKLYKNSEKPPLSPLTGKPEFPTPVDPALERVRKLKELRDQARQALANSAETAESVRRQLSASLATGVEEAGAVGRRLSGDFVTGLQNVAEASKSGLGTAADAARANAAIASDALSRSAKAAGAVGRRLSGDFVTGLQNVAEASKSGLGTAADAARANAAIASDALSRSAKAAGAVGRRLSGEFVTGLETAKETAEASAASVSRAAGEVGRRLSGQVASLQNLNTLGPSRKNNVTFTTSEIPQPAQMAPEASNVTSPAPTQAATRARLAQETSELPRQTAATLDARKRALALANQARRTNDAKYARMAQEATRVAEEMQQQTKALQAQILSDADALNAAVSRPLRTA